MRAAILYDGHADGWSAEDIRQVRAMADRVGAALNATGYQTELVAARPGLEWVDQCRTVDVVFNACEGLGGVSRFEPFIAGVLELLAVPFTGAGARTIALCHDKHVVNGLLAASGLPVPAWQLADGDDLGSHVPLPAIVKPAAEDASVGITQQSVVRTPDALASQIAAMRGKHDRVLVQEYIAGREIAVGFLDRECLPISEIDYRDMPDGAWPILTYDAKWTPGSPEDAGSQPVCPASLDAVLADEVSQVALGAWTAVDGTGYGRVDLRIDDAGRAWVIEVNPNPDISEDAGLARMGRAAGMDYAHLIERVVDIALARHPGVAVAGREAP